MFINEILFLTHTLLVVLSLVYATRLGKYPLMTLTILQGILANLFVTKQVGLFGFCVTCSDVFAIGAILGLNLLQEYYGKEIAKKSIQASFWALLFFLAMSQMHLAYIPASVDTTHGAFCQILSHTPRIALASIGVYYVVQRLDVWLFSALQRRGPFAFRMGFSLLITQFLDTLLFSIFGLYGLVDALFDVILISFVIKCLIISCSSLVIAFSRRYVSV